MQSDTLEKEAIKFYITRHATSVNNMATRIVDKTFDPVLHTDGITNTLSFVESHDQAFTRKPTVVFVSPLIRTWLTAVILYSKPDNDLQLYVAPFLKELHKYGMCSGNHPTPFVQTVNTFCEQLTKISTSVKNTHILPQTIKVSVLGENGFPKECVTIRDNCVCDCIVDPENVFNTHKTWCVPLRPAPTRWSSLSRKLPWNMQAYECDGNISKFIEYITKTNAATLCEKKECYVVAHSNLMRKYVNELSGTLDTLDDSEEEMDDSEDESVDGSEISLEQIIESPELYDIVLPIAEKAYVDDSLIFLKHATEIIGKGDQPIEISKLTQLKKEINDLNISYLQKTNLLSSLEPFIISSEKPDRTKLFGSLQIVVKAIKKLLQDNGFPMKNSAQISSEWEKKKKNKNIVATISELHTTYLRGKFYNSNKGFDGFVNSTWNTFYDVTQVSFDDVVTQNRVLENSQVKMNVLPTFITSENCGTIVVSSDNQKHSIDYNHGYLFLDPKMKKPAALVYLKYQRQYIIDKKVKKKIVGTIAKRLKDNDVKRRKAGGGAKTTRRNRCHNVRYTHQNRRRSTQRRRTRTNVKTRRRQSTRQARRRTMRK